MSSKKTIQRSRKKLPPVPGLNGNKLSMVPGLNGNKLSMVPGLDGNNIYFCTLVSQPTKFYIYMLVAPIRTRAKALVWSLTRYIKINIYCHPNPEPVAIFKF